MKRFRAVPRFLPFLLLFLTLFATVTLAQSGGAYDLSWYTVDSGGVMGSMGGDYRLGATIGQPDAGTLSGGGYTLVGGFWGGAAVEFPIYLPLVLRHG